MHRGIATRTAIVKNENFISSPLLKFVVKTRNGIIIKITVPAQYNDQPVRFS